MTCASLREPDFATFVAQEFARRQEKGVIDAANHPDWAGRIDDELKRWLAIGARVGMNHPEIAAQLAHWRAAGFDDHQARICASLEFCPDDAQWRNLLDKARDKAFADALGHPEPCATGWENQHPSWQRFTTLRRLCTALGVLGPVKIPTPTTGHQGSRHDARQGGISGAVGPRPQADARKQAA